MNIEKILQDEFYESVYEKYHNLDLITKAGFFDYDLDVSPQEYYNLDFLTTPVGKILDNIKGVSKPVVLLTTGGFSPLHDGHFEMLELAKKELQDNGYDVVGGYISPSHEVYVSTKPDYHTNGFERIDLCEKAVKSSDWLMIDKWEALYVPTALNFTDVIVRLEKYLRKHISKKIQVVYVFGSDNAEFMYCFEEKGLGVCVERTATSATFAKVKSGLCNNSNCFFIENDNENAKLSSRNIRKSQNNPYKYDKAKGVYIVRNEQIIPLLHYGIDNISQKQEEFAHKFSALLQKAFNNELEVQFAYTENQLKKAKEILKGKQTISLDNYYRGTFDVEVSRLFEVSAYQDKYISLVGRIGHNTLKSQISKISSGKYTLVDDDSVSGNTIREIISFMPDDVEIEMTHLLASMDSDNIFDVIDLRDFIIGSLDGGLAVRLPNGETARVPYMLPYVCLKTRASVPAVNEFDFSIALWQLNKDFYSALEKTITLGDTDIGFRKAMNYIGFSNKTPLVDICDWHIERLSF